MGPRDGLKEMTKKQYLLPPEIELWPSSPQVSHYTYRANAGESINIV